MRDDQTYINVRILSPDWEADGCRLFHSAEDLKPQKWKESSENTITQKAQREIPFSQLPLQQNLKTTFPHMSPSSLIIRF